MMNITTHIKDIAKGNKELMDTLAGLRGGLLHGRYYSWNCKDKQGDVRHIRFGYITKNTLIVIKDPVIFKMAGLDQRGRLVSKSPGFKQVQRTLFETLCPDRSVVDDMALINLLP
jgi:hypothetical protein